MKEQNAGVNRFGLMFLVSLLGQSENESDEVRDENRGLSRWRRDNVVRVCRI